jgi:hypothetical protein
MVPSGTKFKAPASIALSVEPLESESTGRGGGKEIFSLLFFLVSSPPCALALSLGWTRVALAD